MKIYFSLFGAIFVLRYGFILSMWSSEINTKMGVRLKHCLIETVNKMGYIMCIRECQHVSVCRSVNYNRGKLLCELNWSLVDAENSTNIITDPSYDHVQKKDVQSNMFRNCETAACSSNMPTCIVLRSQQTTCVNTAQQVSVDSSTYSLIDNSTSQSTQSSIMLSSSVAQAENWTSEASTTSTQSSQITSLELTTYITTPKTSTDQEISTSSGGSVCPPSYTSSSDATFCLYLSQSSASRSDAIEMCNTTYNGGNLIFIDSQDTQDIVEDFFSSYASSSNDYVWIDGTKASSWTSSTGVTMTYLNWESSWTWGTSSRNCIKLKISTGKWISDYCSSSHKFICRAEFI